MNDEYRHFESLTNRLHSLGTHYTAIPVHVGLRELVKNSASDLKARMVTISLIQEGRGIDAGPKLLEKLKSQREKEGREILIKILEEEINHVSIGIKWFKHLCLLRRVEEKASFQEVVKQMNVRIIPPLNMVDRERAGFEKSWLEL